jgi:hypothetical protein
MTYRDVIGRKRRPFPRVPSTARIIWLLLYAQTNRILRYDDVRRETGIARRTYDRDLRVLRESGVIFTRESRHRRFLCFDTTLAPVVGAMRFSNRAREIQT